MTGEPESAAAGLVVYVDHSDIHPGCLEDLKQGVGRLVDFIDTHEPQLIAYGFHFDDQAGRMTVTAVHPDSASLELHLEVGNKEFRKLGAMLTLTEIEVYGTISDRARAMLDDKVKMLGGTVTVTEQFRGFARMPHGRS